MAIALSLGCAAVALETASELSSRSMSFHRRLEVLGSRVNRMRTQMADAERELSTMQAERLARARLNRVLAAPDLMLMRLTPTRSGPGVVGLVAISKTEGEAVLEAEGLSVNAGDNCVLWWVPERGTPIKAAEFDPGPEHQVSVSIQMPPRGARISSAIITAEAAKSPETPRGTVILQGNLPQAKNS
jgi:hypothetical protein